jgi:hypothetical protein
VIVVFIVVFIMVLVMISIVIFVVVAVAIAVMIAVAWRLELSILAQVTVARQYFPLIRFARLQSCQLKGMMGASARMVG